MPKDELRKTGGANEELVLWTHDDQECVALTLDRIRGCVRVGCSDNFFICSRKALADFAENVGRLLAIAEADEDVMAHL